MTTETAALSRVVEDLMAVLERYTTGDVTGFCVACRRITATRGGRTPNVLDGQAHLKDCPISKAQKAARKALARQEATR